MASWRQQGLIEAPVEEVWGFVGDPAKYPDWAGDVVEVTGLPRVERDASYHQRMKTPLGTHTSMFRIDELEELHRITLRCTTSGYYSRWLLTEAGGGTFADVEIGVEPATMRYRVLAPLGKSWFRRIADESLDGLRAAAERRRSDPAAVDQPRGR
jgi:uncharacterized protein YndB with AHSA1/START domain